MTKLSKREHLQVTHAIEDTLDIYCRAGCPHLDSHEADRVCMTCPVGVRLQEYGERLIGKEVVVKTPHVRWTTEDDNQLIHLLQSTSLDDVAEKMGRSYTSVWKRRKRLITKGLI